MINWRRKAVKSFCPPAGWWRRCRHPSRRSASRWWLTQCNRPQRGPSRPSSGRNWNTLTFNTGIRWRSPPRSRWFLSHPQSPRITRDDTPTWSRWHTRSLSLPPSPSSIPIASIKPCQNPSVPARWKDGTYLLFFPPHFVFCFCLFFCFFAYFCFLLFFCFFCLFLLFFCILNSFLKHRLLIGYSKPQELYLQASGRTVQQMVDQLKEDEVFKYRHHMKRSLTPFFKRHNMRWSGWPLIWALKQHHRGKPPPLVMCSLHGQVGC